MTTGQTTVDKAKTTVEILKLKDQIRQDKREIRSATYKIGEIYRELHSEDYEEAYEDCFQKIERLEQAIDWKEDALKRFRIIDETILYKGFLFMKERLIFHVDVNSAFLSWEAVYQLKNGASTDIRTIPAIIGGDTSLRKGVVLAKSLPAKHFGIHTGEPVTDALTKCPSLKSFRPNFPLYREYSTAFITILKKYAPVVEQVSIDEAYLDMSGLHYFYSTPLEAAAKIQTEIRDALGFTVNIGISSNKLLAKMASDFEKPDKIHTLFPQEIAEKMWHLPVRTLFFTGRAAAQKLNQLGIYTIGDLAGSDPNFLQAHLNSQGITLWNYANGRDDSPVKETPDAPKGYGNSMTLSKDLTSFSEARPVLLELCETVTKRLRADHVYAQVIEIELKDKNFRRKSHQTVLDYSTNTTDDFYQISIKLFQELWDGTPIRLLGVRGGKLTTDKIEQIQLFTETASRQKSREKMAKLDAALDSIQKKYGKDSVKRGSRC